MSSQADLVAYETNQKIGDELCQNLYEPGENVITTTAVTLQFDDDKGSMLIVYILNVDEDQSPVAIETCADEILTHMSNHDNWPQPILPQEPDCELEFNLERFDKYQNQWRCPEQGDDVGADNSLAYQLKASDILATSDGSTLDTDCILKYIDALIAATDSMKDATNSALQDGLCLQIPPPAQVVAASSAFRPSGSLAAIQSTFYLDPAHNATFATFLDCMDVVREFLGLHDNWGSPLLPTSPGCVALEPEDEYLDVNDGEWTCIE